MRRTEPRQLLEGARDLREVARPPVLAQASLNWGLESAPQQFSSGQRFARALDDGPEKTRALRLAAA